MVKKILLVLLLVIFTVAVFLILKKEVEIGLPETKTDQIFSYNFFSK